MGAVDRLKRIESGRMRTLGKKVLGAAAAGLVLGAAAHAGLSKVVDQPADDLVKAVAAQVDDVDAQAADAGPQDVDEDITTTSSDDTIDYHRLSC